MLFVKLFQALRMIKQKRLNYVHTKSTNDFGYKFSSKVSLKREGKETGKIKVKKKTRKRVS